MVDARSNRRLVTVDHKSLVGNQDGGVRTPWYDCAGNLLDDGNGRKYVYDAGGKLAAVFAYDASSTSSDYGPGFWDALNLTPVARYEYDAIGRLARADFNTNGDGEIDARDWREEYDYDHLWRLVSIWRQGPAPELESNQEETGALCRSGCSS